MLPLQSEVIKLVIEFLNKIYPMSPGLQEDLMARIEAMELKKRQYLLKEGQIDRNMYFVVSGLLRCYYEMPDGTQVNTWFMREYNACVSVYSYYNQAKSYEFIQAIEPTLVLFISYDDLEELYKKHMEFNYIGRVLTTKYLVEWHWQLKDIRLLPTDERYEALFKRDPEIIQRVRKKYLASYLGMLPTSLSRTLDPKKKKRKRKKS